MHVKFRVQCIRNWLKSEGVKVIHFSDKLNFSSFSFIIIERDCDILLIILFFSFCYVYPFYCLDYHICTNKSDWGLVFVFLYIL